MRIGLSCTTIEPQITKGKIDGIGTFTKNLYDALIACGTNVIPVSFPHGIKTSGFENGLLFPHSYTKSTMLSLTNINPKNLSIDLFHTTDHMIPRLKNIPIVANVHDALMFKYPNWFYNTRFATLKKWARKNSLKWVTHYITGANAMIPELVEFCGIPPEKISVVHDGISDFWHEKISEEEKTNTLKKLNVPKNFLLFNGTLHPKKNLPRLAQAFLALPKDMQKEYPLIVVGRGGWDTEDSLLMIKKLEEKKCGKWLDYVNLKELRALFQSATLYLHPSLHEGFGLTLLQAFASGAPVLTSNVTAMPETADGAAFLVDPLNIDNIKNGIEALLNSVDLRKKLIQKGLKRVRDFSWKRCAEETLMVYSKLLS